MSTCTPIHVAANETYAPRPFENTGNIKFYHNNLPRFGNTNEILHLLLGKTGEQDEYIQGLLATPIALAVVIIFWIIILCVFKCCNCCCQGHYWLSGTPVPLPKEPTQKPAVEGRVSMKDAKYAKWKNDRDRVLRQKIFFKSIVAFCSFTLYVTGTVLRSAGANGLESAIHTGLETLYIVEGRMNEGVEFLDEAVRLNQLINDDINSLLATLNGICPARVDQICSNLSDHNSCQEIPGLNIVSEMKQAISFTQDDTTIEVIQDARSSLDDLATQTASATVDGGILDPLDQVLSGILAFGAIVIVVSICLGIVLVIPLPIPVRSALFFLSYGFLVIIILFSFVLVLVLVPTSSAIGDVCYNDPGSRIEIILRQSADTMPTQIQDTVFNIFKGCSAPQANLVEQDIEFETEGFDSAIAKLNRAARICGTPPDAITTLETLLNDGINVHLCETLNVLNEFSDFFTCRLWHPIYVQAAHEAICYEGMDAFSAITNTLFVILCMSLLTVTFRVGLWDAVSSTPLQDREAQKDVLIEDHVKTVEPVNRIPIADLAIEATVTPKKRNTKIRSFNYRALRGNEETMHLSNEWSEEDGLDDQRETVPGGAIAVGEMPQTESFRKKKGTKKRDKKGEGAFPSGRRRRNKRRSRSRRRRKKE